MITQDYLHQLFEYKDGNLYWKLNSANNVKVGDNAGSFCSRGYKFVGINRKVYRMHRLIFLMFHGYLPKIIDHKDGNKYNNKIENLREASMFENQQNRIIQKNNKSGVKNVDWHKKSAKWRVAIQVNKKRKFIGSFKDLELAELVAIEARNKYHKEFARHV
jgi:hypothetical protein